VGRAGIIWCRAGSPYEAVVREYQEYLMYERHLDEEV
jgi:hypothetical protein